MCGNSVSNNLLHPLIRGHEPRLMHVQTIKDQEHTTHVVVSSNMLGEHLQKHQRSDKAAKGHW